MKAFRLVWKCLLLAILDVGTVLLFFTVWDVVHMPIFPIIVMNLLLAVLAVDVAVLAVPYVRRRFPDLSWLPVSLITAFYYITVLLFTALTCTWMAPKDYAIWASLLFMAYIAGALATTLAKRYRRRGRFGMSEQADLIQTQRNMEDLEWRIRGIEGLLEPREFDGLCRAYASLREQLAFSTPFGRSPKPVVMDMEKRISDRIGNCLDKMREVSPQNAAETASRLTLSFMDTSELIRNKEKLMVS